MTKQQEVLRMACKAFLVLHYGGMMTPDDLKLFADLCALALPMKYRFTRSELDEIEAKVKHFEEASHE